MFWIFPPTLFFRKLVLINPAVLATMEKLVDISKPQTQSEVFSLKIMYS